MGIPLAAVTAAPLQGPNQDTALPCVSSPAGQDAGTCVGMRQEVTVRGPLSASGHRRARHSVATPAPGFSSFRGDGGDQASFSCMPGCGAGGPRPAGLKLPEVSWACRHTAPCVVPPGLSEHHQSGRCTWDADSDGYSHESFLLSDRRAWRHPPGSAPCCLVPSPEASDCFLRSSGGTRLRVGSR